MLIGSVHWLGSWQLDDYENPVHYHEWTVRDIDECWKNYTVALDELCATRPSTYSPTPISSRSRDSFPPHG